MKWRLSAAGLACVMLFSQSAGAREVYLVERYYDCSPGLPVSQLVIDHRTYRVLADDWQAGDRYTLPVPERQGYLFREGLSDSLTGTFGADDAYIDLYYTRRCFLGFLK